MFATLWSSLAELTISEPPTLRLLTWPVAPDTVVVALTVVEARIEPVALMFPTLCTFFSELITSEPPTFKTFACAVAPEIVEVATTVLVALSVVPSNVRLASELTVLESTDVITLLSAGFV